MKQKRQAKQVGKNRTWGRLPKSSGQEGGGDKNADVNIQVTFKYYLDFSN